MHDIKLSYTAPSLKDWGNVVDMTRNGCSSPSGDSQGGSVTWSNGKVKNPNAQCTF